MIQRVYEQVSQCSALSKVLVATDDTRILEHVQSWAGQVQMTSDRHPSGTDRCAEALDKEKDTYDYVLNVQGDEPFIDPEQVQQLARLLQEGRFDIATLCKKLERDEDIQNPNVVKVLRDKNQKALYFSRCPIPYLRNHSAPWAEAGLHFKHLGIYGFKTTILQSITQLPPSSLEKAESLEQLRWLENGYSIGVGETHLESHAIDSPEDLPHVEKYWKS